MTKTKGADSATGYHNGSHIGLGERVAVYPYTDKDGNLVARVCRYEWDDENGERQKRLPIDSLLEPQPPPWDAADDRVGKKPEQGGWVHKAPPPAQRPLYRLHQLFHASLEVPIFLPEGEKDVDTCVQRWGFTATTVMDGFANWWGTYALFFEDRHVVVLIDNDDKGRVRGEFLRRVLGRVAAKVDVVLPPVGPKGDITDWAAAHPNATAKDVREMCSANWQPPLDKKKDEDLIAEANKLMAALHRREGWKDLGPKSTVLATELNCGTALDLLEIGVRFDEFNKRFIMSNTGDELFDAKEINDEVVLHLSKRSALIWKVRFKVPALGAEIALRAVHNAFHPVRDYLDGLIWDNTSRVKNWLPTYLGVEPTIYSQAVGEMFLISMVARIYEPGCQADYVLILEGPQGKLKSSALAVLGGEWFSDDLPDIRNKDAKVHLWGRWLLELGEFERMMRVDPITFKAFQTRRVDRFRPPYGRRDVDQPRHCTFAATVNLEEYLTDETGNRRGWPVTCGTINLDLLKKDRDQLFAEAVKLYHDGVHWWPTPEFEAEHFVPQQAARVVESAFDQYVRRVLRRCDDKQHRITLDFIWGLVKGKYPNVKDHLRPRAMKLAGWKATKGKIPGTLRTERYWVRTERAEPYSPQIGTDDEDAYAQEVMKAVDKEEPY
jgi:hypothetical protein